jgi:Pyruvate/2-oxoacid:ferredoxin oxidoreductase gamma subunit
VAANAQAVKAPIFDTVNKLNPMVANILTLGVINGYVNLVKHETLVQAVASRVHKTTVDLNLSALDIGTKVGQGLKKGV